MNAAMTLKVLKGRFSVCRMEDFSRVDREAEWCFTARTDEEYSLVCPEGHVPENVLLRDDGWRVLRVEGVLDFSLVGILAGISDILAQANISLFAVSTYNTDYIFLKEERLEAALSALSEAGYVIEE